MILWLSFFGNLHPLFEVDVSCFSWCRWLYNPLVLRFSILFRFFFKSGVRSTLFRWDNIHLREGGQGIRQFWVPSVPFLPWWKFYVQNLTTFMSSKDADSDAVWCWLIFLGNCQPVGLSRDSIIQIFRSCLIPPRFNWNPLFFNLVVHCQYSHVYYKLLLDKHDSFPASSAASADIRFKKICMFTVCGHCFMQTFFFTFAQKKRFLPYYLNWRL